MVVKIQKWGNSLALRIPKVLANETSINSGSSVDLTLVKGNLIIKPVHTDDYTLDELLSRITKENIHEEISTGDPAGKELW